MPVHFGPGSAVSGVNPQQGGGETQLLNTNRGYEEVDAPMV